MATKLSFSRRLARSLCLVALTAGLGKGTSIVILQGWDRLYIGADSRRTYRIADESYAGSVCKIVPAGKWFFLASGLTYANNQQVSDIGMTSGRSANSMNQAAELFRKRMREFLPKALFAQSRLERVGDSGSQPATVLEAAFAGVDSYGAKVSVEWYRQKGGSQSGKFVTDRRTYSSQTPGGPFQIITLGRTKAIDEHLESRFVEVKTDADAAALLDKLVGFEIAASPQTTALPVDVLRVDGSGASWLRSKPACSAPAY